MSKITEEGKGREIINRSLLTPRTEIPPLQRPLLSSPNLIHRNKRSIASKG